MKSISKRGLRLKPSDTVSLNLLAQQLISKGKPIINLTAGEPANPSPKSACQAGIQAIQSQKTKYGMPSGELFLRKTICDKLLKENNLRYQPDQITVTAGAKQAIFTTLLTLADAGDEVIIPAPYWVTYPQLVHLLGAKPIIIPTSHDSQFKISAKVLEHYITPKTKLLILNTPNNPTGAMYTHAELSAIMKIVCKYGLFVISDEIYEHITYGSARHISPAAIDKNCQSRTIVINGVSKSFAMTGWRIGYAASSPELSPTLSTLQSQTSLHPSMPAQYAAAEALRNGQTVTHQILSELIINRKKALNLLNKIKNLKFIEPQGAFYFFLNIQPWLLDSPINSDGEFCKHLLSQFEVATVPGSAFGSRGFIRISITTSSEQLELGILRISKALSTL